MRIQSFNMRMLLLVGLLVSSAASGQHPFTLQQTLTGHYSGLPEPSGDLRSRFGSSVSISGDWVAIGAYGTDVVDPNDSHGVVFMYENQGGNWTLVQRIEPTQDESLNMSAPPYCGWSVALDGEHLVIGCPSQSGFYLGKTYFYRRSLTGSWVFQSAVQDSAQDQCGYSVDIASTPASSTRPALAVSGCPEVGGGLVRIYAFDGKVWSSDDLIYSGDPGSFFGSSVALYRFCTAAPGGTLCIQRLAVGRPTSVGGSVHLFGGPNWTESEEFVSTSGDFGRALDMNSFELLVGAPRATTHGCLDPPGCGLVQRFERSGSDWSHAESGNAVNEGGSPPGRQNDMKFGQSVALGNDNWIAVGAPSTDGPDGSGGTWNHLGMVELRRADNGDRGVANSHWQGELRPPWPYPGPAGDNFDISPLFGSSLSFDGRWLAVGAPGIGEFSDPDAPRNGVVFMYFADGIFADRFEE
jgi:hypothetical protein